MYFALVAVYVGGFVGMGMVFVDTLVFKREPEGVLGVEGERRITTLVKILTATILWPVVFTQLVWKALWATLEWLWSEP